MSKLKTLEWFMERIGKNVYRDLSASDSVYSMGQGFACVYINDETVARYMFDVQNDIFHESGINLNYRDTK